MMWLNPVERSKFSQFSKPGEGTLTSLSDTGIHEHLVVTARTNTASKLLLRVMYLTFLHTYSEDEAFKES